MFSLYFLILDGVQIIGYVYITNNDIQLLISDIQLLIRYAYDLIITSNKGRIKSDVGRHMWHPFYEQDNREEERTAQTRSATDR